MCQSSSREGWVRRGLILGAAGIVSAAAAFGVELMADERLTAAGERSLLVISGAVFSGALIILCQAIARRTQWK